MTYDAVIICVIHIHIVYDYISKPYQMSPSWNPITFEIISILSLSTETLKMFLMKNKSYQNYLQRKTSTKIYFDYGKSDLAIDVNTKHIRLKILCWLQIIHCKTLIATVMIKWRLGRYNETNQQHCGYRLLSVIRFTVLFIITSGRFDNEYKVFNK